MERGMDKDDTEMTEEKVVVCAATAQAAFINSQEQLPDQVIGTSEVRDPGVTRDGLEKATALGKLHATALSGVDIAFVSPLYRATVTACVMLPRSTKLIFTRDVAELASDKFDRDGTPVDPKSKTRITVRSKELTGRTRRELECDPILRDLLQERSVEWDGISLDDRWWDAPPETKRVCEEKVSRVCERMVALPRQAGVAIVCHSFWLKFAFPWSQRPKGTPNPLGTAPHYWPKNAVPYLGELHSTELRVLRKLMPDDNGEEIAANLRRPFGDRQLLLLRHAHSEAQQLRTTRRRRAAGRKGA